MSLMDVFMVAVPVAALLLALAVPVWKESLRAVFTIKVSMLATAVLTWYVLMSRHMPTLMPSGWGRGAGQDDPVVAVRQTGFLVSVLLLVVVIRFTTGNVHQIVRKVYRKTPAPGTVATARKADAHTPSRRPVVKPATPVPTPRTRRELRELERTGEIRAVRD